jgi:hypothetical protein
MATNMPGSLQEARRLSRVEPDWIWPWQYASFGLWLYAFFLVFIVSSGISERRLGPVDPILWLLPVALLFFMGLGLRMRSKIVTLLYVSGTSVVVLWAAIEYVLYVPFPFLLLGHVFATLLYLPSAGMNMHWSRLRW